MSASNSDATIWVGVLMADQERDWDIYQLLTEALDSEKGIYSICVKGRDTKAFALEKDIDAFVLIGWPIDHLAEIMATIWLERGRLPIFYVYGAGGHLRLGTFNPDAQIVIPDRPFEEITTALREVTGNIPREPARPGKGLPDLLIIISADVGTGRRNRGYQVLLRVERVVTLQSCQIATEDRERCLKGSLLGQLCLFGGRYLDVIFDGCRVLNGQQFRMLIGRSWLTMPEMGEPNEEILRLRRRQ